MMMEIVYIVMIKDGIMLSGVFNDLFEEGEGRKALVPLSPLKFSVHWIFTNDSVSGLYFQYHSGNSDLIWSEYHPSCSLTFRALYLGGRLCKGCLPEPALRIPLLLLEFSFKHGCIPVGAGTVRGTCRREHSSQHFRLCVVSVLY